MQAVNQPTVPTRPRVLYFAARFMGQTSQNVLLAALFVAAATSTRAAIDLSSIFVAILIPAVALGPLIPTELSSYYYS
ncbi:hypothetical protein [Pseudomonas sp.]|uniref:hypothetical protein n=1 Tax=Pseudomonas sp. TaxID=306 RepID=UPI002B74BB7B|nr:hypothetical protein [Pseudomonas sp.]HUE92415.1 hypothetical protein [Pseudomonas sp.]